MGLVQYSKGLFKYMVHNELILESVDNLTQSLVLLPFLQYGFIESFNKFLVLKNIFFQSHDVTLQLGDPCISFDYFRIQTLNSDFKLFHFLNKILLF